MDVKNDISHFMHGLERRNPGQTEFHQAVNEFVHSVMPFYLEHQHYSDNFILERLTEPDRVISFRVCWEDDAGHIRANRAYRVQFNNILGPYKGGLRFQKNVNESIFKFLAFEQCFKNALTGLPMGGAKGGADFNPKGKSDREVMRFCQALMQELHHHIGSYRDVPAGDVGVGEREIAYLFGHYIKLTNTYQGVITGKHPSFGGSSGRREATGYGCIYFLEEMLNVAEDTIKDKCITISGSGVVAIYAAEKAIELGAKVITLSDTGGTLYDKKGIDLKKLDYVKELKIEGHERIAKYTEKFPEATHYAGKKPWDIECDIAIPCAIENEIDLNDAKQFINNGVRYVIEGANMPLQLDATEHLLKNKVIIGPSKAVNAGGVAVSGLEQTQNVLRLYWSLEKVDNELKKIMRTIHKECLDFATYNTTYNNYIDGANIAGFKKIADALYACGLK